MTEKRAWSVILPIAAAMFSAVLILHDSANPISIWIGLAGIWAWPVAWALLGARVQEHTWAAVTMVSVIVATSSVMVLVEPNLMFIQCIAYPLAWMTMPTLRGGVIANAAISVGIGFGFFYGLGGTIDRLLPTLTTMLICFAFSMALGLWISRIAGESEKRKQLLDELRAAQGELAAAHRDTGIAEERARLAREIHDTIAQDLTGIVMLAQSASRDLDAGRITVAAERIRHVESSAATALSEARALVAATAGGLDDGLSAALQRLATGFERETGIKTDVHIAEALQLSRAEEVVLLRCAQESLANVRKHASAHHASLTLRHGELTVSDDGKGFVTTAPPSGFGLPGMRDRLGLMGGHLKVSSTTAGTTVTASLSKGASA